MADTPENTAASMNEKPATPRTRSLWRRVRRATRVVAAVVLGVVGVLALVAWPITFRHTNTVWLRRYVFPASEPFSPVPWGTGIVDYDTTVLANLNKGILRLAYSPDVPSPPKYGVITRMSSRWVMRTVDIDLFFNADLVGKPVAFLDRIDLHVAGLMYQQLRSSPVDAYGYELRVPLWMIVLATGIPAFFLARGITWRRRGPDECVTCGYSRVGLPIGAACPECGAASGEKVKANAEDTKVIGGG